MGRAGVRLQISVLCQLVGEQAVDDRGQVLVVLFNHSNVTFNVKVGDRIAQLIFERISTPEVEEVEQLRHTERGASGFGSTGTKRLSPSSAQPGA